MDSSTAGAEEGQNVSGNPAARRPEKAVSVQEKTEGEPAPVREAPATAGGERERRIGSTNITVKWKDHASRTKV